MDYFLAYFSSKAWLGCQDGTLATSQVCGRVGGIWKSPSVLMQGEGGSRELRIAEL